MSARSFIAKPERGHLLGVAKLQLALAALFCALYGATDVSASLHDFRVPLALPGEIDIPFVPAATLLYSSVYLLFLAVAFVLRTRRECCDAAIAVALQISVAALLFLLLPAEPSFRPVDGSLGAFATLFEAADRINLRYNMAPSLHVAFAVTFTAVFAAKARRVLRVLLVAWGAAIAVSTLLTHQHHAVDVATGALLAYATVTLVRLGLFDRTRIARIVDRLYSAPEATKLESWRLEGRTREEIVDRLREGQFDEAASALSGAAAPDRGALAHARMLVVPAALYRERPAYGGDGRLVRDVASRYGIESELVRVSSVGGVAANAAVIARELEQRTREPLILVSLSKGSADLRVALESLERPVEAPWVWIQICGLPRGTPYADLVLASRWRRFVFERFLARHGGSLEIVEEMRSAAGSRLARPVAIPREIHVVNVVALPGPRDVAWHARGRYRALAKLGPTDAGGLILDSLLLPGSIYVVPRTDHFFRIEGADTLLERLFDDIAESGVLARREVAV